MKEAGSNLYLWMLAISNGIALIMLLLAIKWPKASKIAFLVLFGWASWTNFRVSTHSPEMYLEYGDLAWSAWYRQFINGWFAGHIKLAVGSIAACQGLIAISMLFKGWIFRLGAIGAIIFLVAILPLGVGAGFPCTAIAAVAMYITLKRGNKNSTVKMPVPA